jgi:hypothetical protein
LGQLEIPWQPLAAIKEYSEIGTTYPYLVPKRLAKQAATSTQK